MDDIMDDFTRELSIAISSVRTAARICQTVQRQITPEALEKKDQSPVTIADFASQAAVCKALAEVFPNDPIVGEEDSAELRASDQSEFLARVQQELAAVGIEGNADAVCSWIDLGNGSAADRFWTLDPIDGTKGFLRGQQYAISLALIVNGQISVAALGCPNLPLDNSNSEEEGPGSLLFAVRGEGAFVTSIEGHTFSPDDATAIRVSPASTWPEARLCESVESGHSSHSRSAQIAESLGIVKPPVRLDSQAKYAVVARGEADVYLRLPTRKDYREKIWDHAGGVLVVQEAGGIVTDVTGKPLDFTHGAELAVNHGVAVSNGLLHAQVIDALRDAGVE
jgi:3'(2'), 5'-bisphosphate nucleotidase